MKRSDVISNDNIKAGDVIVGLSSYGQATYESDYNGGMGSNGLTSARHDVFHKSLASEFPESFDPQVPEDLVYSGQNTYRYYRKLSIGCWKAGLSLPELTHPSSNLFWKMSGKDTWMVHCSGVHKPKFCTCKISTS